MESPLDQILRIPCEQLRRNFRNGQRSIEKEFTVSNPQTLDDIKANPSKENIIYQLVQAKARMSGLKRKLGDYRSKEINWLAETQARVDYMENLSKVSHTKEEHEALFEKHARHRLDRLIVDYLLRSGHIKVARHIAQNKDIEKFVDVEVFEACHKVSTSLLEQRTTECLAWCFENRQALRKTKSSLEFNIRLQEYIELLRRGRQLDAIAYSKKSFPSHISTHLSEIQKAAALLAFKPDTNFAPYQKLYSTERWAHLAESFIATQHTLYALSSPPLLHVALSAGLAALKTSSCYSSTIPSTSNSVSSNSSLCPICSHELNDLGAGVPFAHHVRSYVDPDPVHLPSGRIYGQDKLVQFCEKAGVPKGKVRDPTTGDEWDISVMRRAYVM